MPNNQTLKLLASHSRTLALAARTMADRDRYLDMAEKLDAEARGQSRAVGFDEHLARSDQAG